MRRPVVSSASASAISWLRGLGLQSGEKHTRLLLRLLRMCWGKRTPLASAPASLLPLAYLRSRNQALCSQGSSNMASARPSFPNAITGTESGGV